MPGSRPERKEAECPYEPRHIERRFGAFYVVLLFKNLATRIVDCEV
jgi:hypothetical protein